MKQIDTFTPEEDTIIDFSMFDALQAGFGKFVFIIRRSFENFLILSVFQKVKFRPRFFNFHSK
ncbi:hypothetical protein HJ01_03325 [Flavobacterium frigoris PS1]|uniref:Uncharacterized protein n=1 Tax=Flavobacterium frigoris (strain PS1) TaxID=1086011 RepID=H7FVZ9_FLAFP|nr:hypothetical protein HJ01_03325 [Flavobacterium frigoris PS1]